MGFFEFFFPEQAQAEHLREIAQQGRIRPFNPSFSTARLEDLGFLALVLLSLIESLVSKGVLAKEDLLTHLQRLDGFDGQQDCKVNMQILRSVLGLPASNPEAPKPPRKSIYRRWTPPK